MRARLCAAILSGVLVIALLQQASAAAHSELVFTRSMAGTYLKTPDDQSRISFAHGRHVCPRLLPGQTKVLLNSKRGTRPGIWIEDIQSDGRERVCDGDQVSVSSDGRLIVFRREGLIVQRELSSGAERVISPEGWRSCSFPSFCPEGRVLFVSADRGKCELYLADPANTASPQFLFNGEIESAPRCSPDGTAIAYQNGPHIYLFDLHTRSYRRLTFAGGVQSWPMWSRDGKSIAYLQSPAPFDGPWHIYTVQLQDPREVSLVWRDVEPAPDWNGVRLPGSLSSTLKGDGVSFWRSERAWHFPIEIGMLPEPQCRWDGLPADGAAPKGELVVGCEWGTLRLSSETGKLSLVSWGEAALTQQAEICLLDEQGNQAQGIESINLSPPGVDAVAITAVFHSDGGNTIAAALSVSRTRPCVEIKPTKNVSAVLVKRPLQLALVPDRLASDLTYDSSDYTSQAVSLPRSPFMLAMPTDESGLLMLVTPSRKQTVQLVKDKQDGAFSGVQARCGGESVFVSVLPGGDLWHTTKAKAAGEGKPWEVVWSNPFPAQWRLTIQGQHQNFAMMATMDAPAREKTISLEETRSLRGSPGRSIIYLHGRSQNTPLDTMTPMDILRDAMGIGRASALLDVEGIRTYRHAQQWVPYKDPRLALKILWWIRRRDRPGGQKRVDDVCQDILLSLQGLDSRIKEYDSFAAELEQMRGQATASDPAKALLESAQQQVAQLREQLAQKAMTPVSEVAEKAKAFRSSANAYKALEQVVLAALSERWEVLTACRGLARRLREQAGLTVARSSESRDVCEQIRELAGNVLRKRYYLEGDWRGEKPLGGPEVPYDEVSKL